MKTSKFIVTIFITSIFSCTTAPDDESGLIIGEWQANYVRHYNNFTFYPQLGEESWSIKFNSNGILQFFKNGVHQPQNGSGQTQDFSWRIKDTSFSTFPKPKFVILTRDIGFIDTDYWMIDTLTPNRFVFYDSYSKVNGVNVIHHGYAFDKIN